MTEVDLRGFPSGAPWWLDLTSPDLPVAQEFLTGLFGWDAEVMRDVGVSEYTVLSAPGPENPSVAGLMPASDPEVEPLWTCFFLVDDLRTAADSVRQAGGMVLMDITPIGDIGDMFLAIDPQGAGFGLWVTRPGISPMNTGRPGTLHLIDLLCPDPGKAATFYESVLGTSPSPARPGEQNIGWRIGEAPGVGRPGRWTPYFTVSDLDALLGRAGALGAVVESPPSRTGQGHEAVVSGPATAPFGLIEVGEGTDAASRF